MTRYRKQRVSEQLLEFLTEELQRAHEEALQFVYLTGLEITPDLKIAKIFWMLSARGTLFLAQEDSKPSDAADKISKDVLVKSLQESLVHAKGALKCAIAAELTLRFVPELEFKYDDSIERGNRIDELLRKAGFN